MKIHAIQLNDGTVRVIRIPTANSDPSITADEKIMIELDIKNASLVGALEGLKESDRMLKQLYAMDSDTMSIEDLHRYGFPHKLVNRLKNALPAKEGKEEVKKNPFEECPLPEHKKEEGKEEGCECDGRSYGQDEQNNYCVKCGLKKIKED